MDSQFWSGSSKIGVNAKKMPNKTPVFFVVIDNKHLNENGIRYFCALAKRFVLITSDVKHPAFNIEKDKLYYYRGLKEFENERGYLIDTCLSAQDMHIELLKYFAEE